MFKSEFITAEKLLNWNIKLNLNLNDSFIKKGQLLLKGGQPCNHFYYVIKGCLRVYYYDLNGNEITHWFSTKDTFITSPLSFFRQEENILYIEALEDTTVLLITSKHFEVINANTNFDKEFYKLSANFAITLSRRIMDIHTKTAQERYFNLIQTHPYLLQKAKLGHIASFLGITPQSLSRIRKNT